MFEFLASTTLMSCRAPRAAMRRVLDMIDSFEGAALIFGIAFAANAMIILLMAAVVGARANDLDELLMEFFVGAQAFLASTVAIYLIGRRFGGRGRLRDIAMAMAWFSFATVVFAPVWFLATMPWLVGRTLASVAGIAVAIGSIWLWANFVAEAHRFESALRVAIVVGIILALGVLILLVALPVLAVM